MQEKLDYYVYIHKRKDTGEVFYVGSGRKDRCCTAGGRTKDWSAVVEEHGYEFEILHSSLNKTEALDIETRYIINPNKDWKLVNKAIPTRAIDLDYELLSEYFYYDPTSPSGLRYNKDIYRLKNVIHSYKGDVAGSHHVVNGRVISWRIKLTVNGTKKAYKVHRIIWLLVNGTIDPMLVVDHIDNDPTNNNISNLRLVTQHQNGRNKAPVNASSKTGIVGVIKRKTDFLAQLRDENECRTTKSYSFKKYGEEKAFYLAVKARYEYLMAQPNNLRFSDTHSCLEELIKIITNFEGEVQNGFGTTDVPCR